MTEDVDLAEIPAFPLPRLDYISIGQLSADIGAGADNRPIMNRPTAEDLAKSGVIDALVTKHNAEHGRPQPEMPIVGLDAHDRVVVHSDAVEVLRNLPWVDLSTIRESVFNVRVRPGRVDTAEENERSYWGWHASMTDDEAREAVTKWWQAPRENMTGHPFIATIRGFVVYVGRIREIRPGAGRHIFDVDADDELTATWLFHRVQTPRGGNTAVLRPPAE